MKNKLSFTSSLLKKLNIRINEKSVFVNFFLFNLILYAGVFLGRAIKDALFFSKIGAQYLPIVFIANAITMSIFGTYFARWTGKGYSLKKVSVFLFTICAILILFFSFLFSLELSNHFPGTGLTMGNLVIILFYWLTEIPIFLMLNVIWIISENYISENMGQRLNPKIIGGGHLGIVIGGIIAVYVPSLFNIEMQSLAYVWGGIVLLEIFMIGLIYKVCRPLPRDEEEDLIEEETGDGKTGFFENFMNSFRIVRRYRYSVFFALLALFNFFLFGINDYMLNTRAIDASISEANLVSLLGYFTIGFGLFSALFQFAFFTRIIKKFGIAKTNLGGGIVFVIGSAILLLTSTHMFEPVQKLFIQLFHIERAWLLLYSIALVRFGGYIAEYLFNQTVIPSIYGAIPDEDREVTRTFIEGTFVQTVFGMTGILLILYKLVFKANLDLLILMGAVSASLMVTFSWLMVAEYKKMIALSKMNIQEQIISREIGKISREKVQALLKKKNTFIKTALIEFLAKNERVEFIEDIYGQLGREPKINAAVIDGIIQFNNLDYFDKLLERYIEFELKTKRFMRFKRSQPGELRALLSGFYKMHHNYDTLDMFAGVENNPHCSEEEKQEIIYFLSKLDNKNGIIKAGQLLHQLKNKDLAMSLSAEIGFDNFSREIQNEIDEILAPHKEERDYDRLTELVEIAGKMNYASQATQFAVFESILQGIRFLESRSICAVTVKKMMEKNKFLVLIALHQFLKPESNMPREELPFLLENISCIDNKAINYLDGTYDGFSKENIPLADGFLSINWLLEDFIKNGNPGTVLQAYQVLQHRLEKESEPGYTVAAACELAENELQKLYFSWALMKEWQDIYPAAYILLQRRIDQYYKQSLLYALKFLTEADFYKVELFYKHIMSGNRTLKDNAISLMEQAIPREFYEKIDSYFYLDDETNHSRESDLTLKAKELYGEEVKPENALKILKDNILEKIIQENREVNHGHKIY